MRSTWLLVSGVVVACGNVSETPDAALDAALKWLRKYLGPLDGVETIIAGVERLRAELARTTALMFEAQNNSVVDHWDKLDADRNGTVSSTEYSDVVGPSERHGETDTTDANSDDDSQQ